MLHTYTERDDKGHFVYSELRNDELQYWLNNFKLVLNDHNKGLINPGFISYHPVKETFHKNTNAIHFLIKGSAILNFNGEEIDLCAGDIFMLGSSVNCFREYTSQSEEITVYFNAYLTHNTDDLFSGLINPIILHNENDNITRMHALITSLGPWEVSSLEIYSILVHYLSKFIWSFDIKLPNNNNNSRYSPVFEPVFKFIEENLSVNLKVEDICKATKLSIGTFTKKFPRDYNITVKEYIHRKVMFRVEQMLIHTDSPINEISSTLGFCDAAYFTKWFIKKKGITPKEYRKFYRSEK